MIATKNASEAEFTFTRTFDASRSQVWAAFTQPEHLKHWWGPKGCGIEIAQFNLTPGGVFLYSMTMPDGSPIWGRFVYCEIAAPERLVFVNSFSDENGGLARNPWNPAWPLETLTTIVFAEENGKTTLTLSGGPIHCTEEERSLYRANADSMNKGFNGSFDVLAAYLPIVEDTSNRELRALRVFDAPRDLVFRMWTEAEHLVNWWGPNGFTITIEKMDVRVGGDWVLVMHGPDGRDYPNHKRYLEIDSPRRLAFEHVSEPRHRTAVDFHERGARTEVAVHMVFESIDAYNFVVREHHADTGLTQTLDRLGELLARR
jgi:uncharacterized protein YndB with AHSA1/START domain